MKIVLVVILLGITTLFGLFTSVGAQEKMEESFVILMAARNAAKEGLTDKAMQRYEAYLKEKPGDREGGLEYADFLQNCGRYQEADARYEILIELLKEKPEAKDDFARKLLLNAARNAVKNKHEGRAVGYFKKALTYGPDDPQLYWEITGLLAKLGKTEDAFELCEKVLSLESQNREVMMLKINLLVRLKRYSEAREALAKIPRIGKDNLMYLQLDADIEAWSGNYAPAIAKYQELIKKYPENRGLWAKYINALSWAREWKVLLDIIDKKADKIEITDDIRTIMIDAYLSTGEDEKAMEVWETISTESDDWRNATLRVVDKFLSRRELATASNILKKVLSTDRPAHEVHLVTKSAIIYASREMPGMGLKVLSQFPASPQTKPIFDMARAEILSLAGRYEESLSILHTLQEVKEIGLRPRIIELECYYALEMDEMLLEKSPLVLERLSQEELIDRAKVLTLRILSNIRIGQYEKAQGEIGFLSNLIKQDVGPAILTVMLHEAGRQLKEYDESIRGLGRVLSEFSMLQGMVRPQLLDDVPPDAWMVAYELSGHQNEEVIAQLARAELKAGNFQTSLQLYGELYERDKDAQYKLGMIDCYLSLNETEKASQLFDDIQILTLPESDIARYLEAMVRIRRDKQKIYIGLSLLPEDITETITHKAITIIANIQSGDRDIADEIIKKCLSNQSEHIAVFEPVMIRVGYFDRGKKTMNYEFARDWLQKALEQFPDDRGLRYQYAKLLATHNDYDSAVEQFAMLQGKNKDSTEDVRVIRWLAQTNSWRQHYDESLEWYGRYFKKRPFDFKRRRDVARVYGWAARIREANKAYKALCEEYPEDSELFWEWQAKRNNWLGRRRTAISYYEKMVERHPADTELLFDLGQMYSILDLDVKAEDTYKKLHVYAPEHNRADFARESEQWSRRQSLGFKQSYIHQKGSGDTFGNYEITMLRTDLTYMTKRLSEATDLSLGLGDTVFKFKEHDGSIAERLTLDFHKYFENGIKTYLEGELSSYSENRHETIQYEAGAGYRIFDIFDTTLFGGREDVLQNFNTLQNGRARDYSGVRLNGDITHRIDLFSQVKQCWFNDGNNGIEDYTVAGYKLHLYPKILKFIVETYGFDTHAKKDEYWSPDNYRKYMAGLVWRHYLGKEHFQGAPVLYYEVAVKEGLDDDGVNYIEPKFECGWDTQRRWNMGLEIRPTRSSVYEEEQAAFFINYRF